jgi:hypothetical protein
LPKFVSGRWDYFNNGGSLTFPAPQFVSGGWDNRSMRIKIASAIVAMSLLASTMASVAPANAIFGLSKCEKVHKEMKSIENRFLADSKKIRAYPIKDGTVDVLVLTPKSVNLIQQIVNDDPIPRIWKIGFNNPKCFTNTQNIQIKNIGNGVVTNYFYFEPFYSTSSKCTALRIGLIKDKKAEESCSKPRVQVWRPVKEYKSIYSY